MAAVDEKLRMSIVTALDNAGIKATQDQIDGLASKIQKVNSEAKMDRLEGAIGDLPGKIGKIGKALTGIPGQIAMITGAFTTGYEIGEKLGNLIAKAFGWDDAVEKIKKANRALAKELAQATAAFETETQRRISLQDLEVAKIDNAIAKINQQALAYTRLSKAASEFANAGADQDIQQLERERFEDMIRLQSQGEYEAAEQASKVYDILKQELQAKKELASYDEESARFEAQRAAKEQEAFEFLKKVDNLQAQRKALEGRLDELDDDESITSKAAYDKLAGSIQRRIAAVEKQLGAAEATAERYMADLSEGDIASLTRQRNRATLAERLNLDRDKLLWDYDTAITQNGDSLGISFTQDYIEQAAESSKQSYEELKMIKDNTERLAEKLDELLSVKQ